MDHRPEVNEVEHNSEEYEAPELVLLGSLSDLTLYVER